MAIAKEPLPAVLRPLDRYDLAGGGGRMVVVAAAPFDIPAAESVAGRRVSVHGRIYRIADRGVRAHAFFRSSGNIADAGDVVSFSLDPLP
jgi:hypothetical protein